MALVLSMREGDDFYVGEHQFVLDTIEADTLFRVRRAHDGKVFKISEDMGTEIDPTVYASAGERHQAGLARVAIEAPRSLLIIRGEKFRNPPSHVRTRA